MSIIDVKYVCETDGYKIYRRDNNNFIIKLFDITLDPSDEEVGVFEYGTYDDVTGKYVPN
jgi:hypothetical protein